MRLLVSLPHQGSPTPKSDWATKTGLEERRQRWRKREEETISTLDRKRWEGRVRGYERCGGDYAQTTLYRILKESTKALFKKRLMD